jgi:NitT/TauT family transport system substrate-binding protein
MKRFSILIRFVVFIVTVFTSVACSKSAGMTNDGFANTAITPVLRVGRGNGFSYAPFYCAEKLGLFEKYLPGTKIEVGIINETAKYEAFAAGRLDFSFSGYPAFIIAWDKGIDVQAVAACSNMVHELTVRTGIKSLRDFAPSDKIALPELGSTHQLWLAMACEREFGNAHALDNNLVVMSHPDAYISLINGNISAHFTQLPYIAKEHEAGFSTILTNEDIFVNDATTVIVAAKKICSENPLAVNGFLDAISEAMCLIYKRDSRVLSIIAEMEKLSLEEVIAYLYWEGVNYTTTLYGLEGFIDIMAQEKFISKKPALEEILWEPALAAIGKRSGEPGILEKAQKRGE